MCAQHCARPSVCPGSSIDHKANEEEVFCFGFALCLFCWVLWNICEEKNVNVCANQVVCSQRDKTGFQETGEFVFDQLNQTTEQRLVRAGRGPQTPSGSSLGRRKHPLDPHPHIDTKERKIALYFNCLQCVRSLSTAFTSWLFEFVTNSRFVKSLEKAESQVFLWEGKSNC